MADQTNLLAINAVIEAALSVEQGKVFALVAEEVRKLAEQSSVSTAQIATLIGNIQHGMEQTVSVMEAGKNEVSAGVEAVNLAGKSFKTIAEEVNRVAEQIQQVTDATQEMASGTAHVVKSVEGIGLIAQQNAEGSEEVSAASEEQAAAMVSVSQSADALARLEEDLALLVSKFKV
ncbi:methyl-accepting chemotaxis protein [Desulfosporosinus sp. PR]|uniref:methyl-accepting chemotaxis protein n=1 Tax=Candidatus Desulfosporosinus nitrosoreducens TaxID=3401928 RepID=UPI002800128E|nr:methyl-accepting chemotaxis protein [Desulfosporosinus sp. PR]MDQ7092254.1 methyl-accepting chemotaxis protein [Desulfosporosinus sp. PR]